MIYYYKNVYYMGKKCEEIQNCGCKKCKRGKRGHKGEKGDKGNKGDNGKNGTQSVAEFYSRGV